MKAILMLIFGFLFRRYARKDPKRIFQYFDGLKKQYADPLATYCLMNNLEDVDFDSTEQAEQVALGVEPYASRWDAAIRAIFNLGPFDAKSGKGLTNAEVIDLSTSFFIYMSEVKKNINPPPTSSEPTDLGSSTSTEAPPETTNVGSGSGVTPNASSSDVDGP